MNRRIATLISAACGALCLGLLAACGSGSGGPAANVGGSNTPPNQEPDPDPPPSPYVVSGEVFSFDTGMVDNAALNVYVYTPGFVYSYWHYNGPVYTDGLGQFQVEVPESQVAFLAFKDGFVQPCGMRRAVTEDTEVRIEMLPVSVFNRLHAPRPQTSVEPSVTGFIFETTAAGRQPLHDVRVWAEDEYEIGYARTRSDRSGGLYLCNLPDIVHLSFIKDGYETVLLGPLDPKEPLFLEVEMHRNGG